MSLNAKHAMDKFLYLSIENGRWHNCPESIRRYLDIYEPNCFRGHGDHELCMWAFPKTKFSNMDKFEEYLCEQHKCHQRGTSWDLFHQRQFAATKVSRGRKVKGLFRYFWDHDFHYVSLAGIEVHLRDLVDGRVPIRGRVLHVFDWDEYFKNREVLLQNKQLFQQDPYRMILPSGELEFQEMRPVRWDGNEKFVMACDSGYWYYFHFCTS